MFKKWEKKETQYYQLQYLKMCLLNKIEESQNCLELMPKISRLIFLKTQVIVYFFQGIFPDHFELRGPYQTTVIPPS